VLFVKILAKESSMKVLVTYYSETGNTKKLAESIHNAVPEAPHVTRLQADLLPVNEATGAQTYDLIFCGFPVQTHSVPPAVIPFITAIPAGTKVAFFATHGSLRGGRLAKEAFEHALSLASRAKVLGTFGTRGKVRPSVIEALQQKPEHAAWAQEALGAINHPDEADLHDARDFAATIIAKAAQ